MPRNFLPPRGGGARPRRPRPDALSHRLAERSSPLHVFLDESGGTSPADDIFLVAAVAIAPGDAVRLVKSFRKATRAVGELHGHQLDTRQRAIFLGLLARETASVVVACRRRDPLGGWAMSALPEADLYGHLLAEACAGLPGYGGTDQLAVTPDGGRYPRARLDRVRAALAVSLAAHHAGPVDVDFRDSAAIAGLQVADILANSAFQMIGRAGAAGELLAPLIDAGRLRIQPLRLAGVRPDWIAED